MKAYQVLLTWPLLLLVVICCCLIFCNLTPARLWGGQDVENKQTSQSLLAPWLSLSPVQKIVSKPSSSAMVTPTPLKNISKPSPFLCHHCPLSQEHVKAFSSFPAVVIPYHKNISKPLLCHYSVPVERQYQSLLISPAIISSVQWTYQSIFLFPSCRCLKSILKPSPSLAVETDVNRCPLWGVYYQEGRRAWNVQYAVCNFNTA